MTRRTSAAAVAWVSGASFLAVFTGLALQLRTGRDPAVGTGSSASAVAVAPRRVLIRRVIEKRVVVHVVPAEADASSPAAARPSAPAGRPPAGTGQPAARAPPP